MLKISRPGKPPAFVQIDIGDVGATVERFEAIGEDHARAFQLRCPLHRKRGSQPDGSCSPSAMLTQAPKAHLFAMAF